MRIRAVIRNIKWETDGEKVEGLPNSVIANIDVDPETIEDDVSDYLSDEYGFCHNGFEFSYKEIKE